MNTEPIRVIIVDDHIIVRKGMRAFLAEIDDIEVVGDAGSGPEAIQLVTCLHPDVILLDLKMPEMDGIQISQQITSQYKDVRILIMTSFTTEENLLSALQAGAHGYLLKDSAPSELIRKIFQIQCGESDLHPSLARKIQEIFKTSGFEDSLSTRETQILKLMSKVLDEQKVAQTLDISIEELHRQQFQIIQKLHEISQQ
ncbi:MAG: response regulator transcription factor [Anaerolineales bacterium]|jgi:NarL family two-component system response regulator LiaR